MICLDIPLIIRIIPALSGDDGLGLCSRHAKEAAVKHLGSFDEAAMACVHHVAQGLPRVKLGSHRAVLG